MLGLFCVVNAVPAASSHPVDSLSASSSAADKPHHNLRVAVLSPGTTGTHAIFDSMCMLGFLLYTLAVMCATVDTYMKLGFVGSKFAQMESEGTLVADVERSDLFLTAVRELAEKQAEAGAGEGSADEVGIELT